jgi:Gluconate 2-dehydrogenase subunit 3/TAT (twin-arginine translocation) pathway signal sequence
VHQDDESLEVSRRDALKIAAGLGAAAVIPLVPADAAEAALALQQAAARAKAKLKFFTSAQHRTVDALSEVIIPTDDRSPGAKAAKVADYIDFMLGESPAETKKLWTDGLAELDRVSVEKFERPFVGATQDQQAALLAEISANEAAPVTPLEVFFKEAKGRTIVGYYTSEIGIHKELKYKGNQFLTEFVGCDHPEHMS